MEQLWQDYRERGVQVLVIDVKESDEDTRKFAERSKFTFPVLLDRDGSVASQYAPEGVLPDLERADIVIASNLLIDREGVIRYMSLLDTTKFDAKLIELKSVLDGILEAESE